MAFYTSNFCLIGHDAGDQASGDGTTTLTDVEALASLGGDGVVRLQDHLDVVTGLDAARLVAVGEAQVGSLI